MTRCPSPASMVLIKNGLPRGLTMQGAFGAFVAALAAGILVVVFLKNGVASIGIGSSGWPQWNISCATNPKLYWTVVAVCAIVALYAALIGLQDIFASG
jgi:hypothetical protein